MAELLQMKPTAKRGHFKHRHPGNCKPCGGWGFLIKMLSLPPMNPTKPAPHPVFCRDCKGVGWTLQ